MAGSVNKCIIVGNLGRDPEIRRMQSGDRVANLRVATSESWRDKQTGERREKTEWHAISVMNDRLAEVCEKYLRKGSKVYVEGSLETRKWTDKEGQERYTTEVVIGKFRGDITILDSRDSADDVSSRDTASSGGASPKAGHDLDDDVPF